MTAIPPRRRSRPRPDSGAALAPARGARGSVLFAADEDSGGSAGSYPHGRRRAESLRLAAYDILVDGFGDDEKGSYDGYDLQTTPRESPFGSFVESPVGSLTTSPLGSPIGSTVGSHVGSPAGSPPGSPVGSVSTATLSDAVLRRSRRSVASDSGAVQFTLVELEQDDHPLSETASVTSDDPNMAALALPRKPERSPLHRIYRVGCVAGRRLQDYLCKPWALRDDQALVEKPITVTAADLWTRAPRRSASRRHTRPRKRGPVAQAQHAVRVAPGPQPDATKVLHGWFAPEQYPNVKRNLPTTYSQMRDEHNLAGLRSLFALHVHDMDDNHAPRSIPMTTWNVSRVAENLGNVSLHKSSSAGQHVDKRVERERRETYQPQPIFQTREPRPNPEFLRMWVLEHAMRQHGKVTRGRAVMLLAARADKVYTRDERPRSCLRVECTHSIGYGGGGGAGGMDGAAFPWVLV